MAKTTGSRTTKGVRAGTTTTSDTPDERLLYQPHPAATKPSLYKPSGWTETVAGYVREARMLAYCVRRNEWLAGHPYPWFVTINVDEEHTAAEVNGLWRRVSRRLRDAGLVALWVREVCRSNRVHYHLLLRTRIGRDDLGKAVASAMQPEGVRWHWRPQMIEPGQLWELSFYIAKAQKVGYVNGRRVADYYADKRLLFRPKSGVRKLGQFGGFWVNDRTAIWQEAADRERRIAQGLDRPEIRALADYVYIMMDRTEPPERIDRSFGFYADCPAVRRWAEQVAADAPPRPNGGEADDVVDDGLKAFLKSREARRRQEQTAARGTPAG